MCRASGYEPGEQLSYQPSTQQVDTATEVQRVQLYSQQIDMEETKSYSIEKLNEINYHSWSQVVKSHLDDQDLWEVVQGIETRPECPQASTTSTAQTSEQSAAAAMEDHESRLEG